MRLLVLQHPSNGVPTGCSNTPPIPPRPLEGGRGVGSPALLPPAGISLSSGGDAPDTQAAAVSLLSRGRT
jgi:hypothetical protein